MPLRTSGTSVPKKNHQIACLSQGCFIRNLKPIVLASSSKSTEGFTIFGHGGHLGSYRFPIAFTKLETSVPEDTTNAI